MSIMLHQLTTFHENFIVVIYKQLATFANPIIVAMQL